MSVTYQFGKGQGDSYTMTFGMSEAEITKSMENKTLKQIANQLRKQAKITNGELILYNIGFRCCKARESTHSKKMR